MAETATDPVETCSAAGCGQPSTGWCAHCKSAGYCGVDHMVKDYGRHQSKCASCIQRAAGSVMWAAEVEVGHSQGEKEQQWEPLDLVHARANERGIVTAFVSNRELLDQIGAVAKGGFATRLGSHTCPTKSCPSATCTYPR